MKSNFSQEVFSIVEKILKRNNCDMSNVVFAKNKTNNSIRFFGTTAFYVLTNKKGSFLYIPDKLAEYAYQFYAPFDNTKKGIRFKIDDLEILDGRFEKIVMFVFKSLQDNQSVEEFGCCSHYLECSDKKKCVNELVDIKGRKISAGCHYRQKIEKGIIFYGENATI